jgi:hypothetical protein
MKRLSAVVLGAGLVVVFGCGTQNYEYRLEHTIEQMKFQKRLNDNLTAAPTKGKLEELQIYVRPPKNMTGPTQTFQMTVVEPGKFDVESSFIEQDKQSLHILARVERPKTPSKKAPTPAASTPRGEFNADVVDLVKSVYGDDKIDVSKFKEEKKGNNDFKAYTLDLNAKKVQIHLYGSKTSPYKVALIFEYPATEQNAISPKSNLCLESFAVGEKARRAFAGGDAEEEIGGEGSGEETSAPAPL